MSKKSRMKSYSAEFREKAIRLVQECGQTIPPVAQHLGYSHESIRRWIETANAKLDPDTTQRIKLETSELKRLRKENAQLKMENDILKKATAYFAKEVM
jgi:transposase